MAEEIELSTHPDFTAEEFIAATGWEMGSGSYRQHLAAALDYFQRVVPRSVLRTPVTGSPWVPKIAGMGIVLASWMQGIDFRRPVNPNRWVQDGDALIGFKDPAIPLGSVRGSWFTVPMTPQGEVAIHSTQTRLHTFKALSSFPCLESSVSDAYVGWVSEMPAEYRHGGAQQLFIWDAPRVLAAG